MFTLSLATEREFNLSCPALLLSLPISESEQPCKSDAFIPSSTVSSTLAIASVETTKPTESQTTTISSTTQKLSPIPLPYHIPDHPYFKPITPNYPFQLFHPNVPPIVAPFDSRAVVTPSPITQRPQTPIDPKPLDPKPPQVWYPWYPKPNLIPAPEPAKSIPVLPPREPVLPPTEAPKPSSSPLVYLLTPTSIPLQDKTTTPRKPPVQWAPVYPPRKLVYPFYLRNPGFVNTSSAAVDQLRPGKPGFVDTTSVALGQGPHWLYPSQTRPRPDEPPQIKPFEQHALPIPAPTKKVESPQLLHFPWYKPYQEKHLEMPSVPIKVPQIPQSEAPQSFSISSIQGPPLNLHFTSSTYPTSAPSKTTEVAYTSAPTKPPLTQSNLSHALFHCPTCCPGPPSISYHCHNHHHNHHYFAHPHLAAPILTKLTAEIQSFPSSSSALFQGVGYNSSPYSSKVEALAPAAQYVAPIEYPFIKPILAPDSEPLMRPTLCPYTFRTVASNLVSSQSASKPTNIPLFVRPWEPTKPPSRSSQNASVVESVAHSVQSPTPALYQAKMQHYISQWRQHMPPFVAPNNAERVLQSHHEVSLKPTTPPTDDKSLSNNYWYQAASYPRPPMSNAPAEFFKQASVNNDHTSLQSAAPSQPKQTHNMDVPIQLNVHPSMYIHNSVPGNTQLYDHQNGEPSVPIFRDPEPFGSYWVPAVQSNQKTVQSTHYQDGKLTISLGVL